MEKNKDNRLVIIVKIEKYIEYMLTILLKLPRTEKLYLSSEKWTIFSIIKFTYFYCFSKKLFLHICDLHFLKDLICGLCKLIYQP